MSGISIQGAVNARQDLEVLISNACTKFSNDTGLEIDRISILTSVYRTIDQGFSPDYKVKVEAKL